MALQLGVLVQAQVQIFMSMQESIYTQIQVYTSFLFLMPKDTMTVSQVQQNVVVES